MGILGKIVSTASQLVTAKGTGEKITGSVGNAISNKMISKCEEELKVLEISFEVKKQEYLKKKEKLQPKAQQGDRGAIKKLQNLENEFKIVLIEYEGNKRVILAKQPILEERHKNISKEQLLENALVGEGCNQEKIEPTVKCEKCGHTSPKGIKFCSNCGAEIITKVFCTNCGEELSPTNKFCSRCGHEK